MFWEKDLSIFMKEFAEVCTLTNGSTFRAIFENRSEIHETMNEYSSMGYNPNVLVASDVVLALSIKKGTVFSVEGQNYKVKQLKHEIGFCQIDLEKRA
jgi:hypothetical protein